MIRARLILRDERATSAVEFALVVPLMLFFLLGIIDVGRFIWSLNQAEKATQIGARWAVVTDMIPSGLRSYSFATQGGVPQGGVVNDDLFPGIECRANGCFCPPGETCIYPTTRDTAAFNRLVGRMNEIYGGIGSNNVTVRYDWSGLGYAGDPTGPDVSPLVTVEVRDLPFRPVFLANILKFSLPKLSYTLTMEDGQGTFAN